MAIRSWLRKLFASHTPRTVRKAPARSRLSVEILEDRLVLSTYTVNTLLDNTDADTTLSLREAILLVNNGGDAQAALGRSLSAEEAALVTESAPVVTTGIIPSNPFDVTDTIRLPAAAPNQSLTLSSVLPSLSRSVEIEGPGAANLTVVA